MTTEGRLGERLRRILTLIPYAIRHEGVTVDELSRTFGVPRDDLIADLDLVFLCGLPGYGPGDLIQVDIDAEGGVEVQMADYFGAPLRLTPAEAISLYAGAEALLALPGMENADALRRAVAKLGRATGIDEQEGAGPLSVQLTSPASHLETIQEAIASSRRLRLEYYAAARGEMTEREVDPWGLVAALGQWYLVAFDHLRDDERMFRVDRIKDATVLATSFDPPEEFDPKSYGAAFFGLGEGRITLELAPDVASWFTEYYPVSSEDVTADGWHRVTLVVGGARWAASLLLQLGAGARAIEPPEIVDAARELARELAARHS